MRIFAISIFVGCIVGTVISNLYWPTERYTQPSCADIMHEFHEIKVTENKDGTCQGYYQH